MDSAEQALLAELNIIGPQILGTKQVTSAFFALLIYDHILTLPDEIEYIWKRKFTIVSFLFCMNRYYALAVLTICYTSIISPIFTPEICRHFSLFFPLAGGIVLTMTPDIVLALRVCALYERNRTVAFALILYLTAELGVAIWIYATPGSHALALPSAVQGKNDTFHLCIEETADSLGNMRAATFQLMQTIFDTGAFIMIVLKALADKQARRKKNILTVMALHGVTYYAALFSANIAWALMILFAPVGIKYTSAFPTFVLACTLVNRITLSLRRFSSLPLHGTGVAVGMAPWISNATIHSSTEHTVNENDLFILSEDIELQERVRARVELRY